MTFLKHMNPSRLVSLGVLAALPGVAMADKVRAGTVWVNNDGGTSWTAVGGRVFSSTADSAALAQAAAGYVAFATSYSIPANVLIAGTALFRYEQGLRFAVDDLRARALAARA